MINCPDITKAELKKLRTDGIEPTLDELTTLIMAGRAIESPRPPMIPAVTVPPVAVCEGVIMWPLTLQAALWHNHALDWWRGTMEQVGGYGYALCHGRIKHHFDALYDETAARLAVDCWLRRLSITLEELSMCIMSVSPEAVVDVPLNENSKKAEWGDILAELEASTGEPIDYWLTNTSDYALSVLEKTYKVRAQASGAQWKEGRGLTRENIEFMECVRQIREAHKDG